MKTIIENKVYFVTNQNINNNTYVLLNKNSAIVIDISWNYNEVINFLKNRKIDNLALLITHCHFDHIADIDKLLNEYKDLKIYVSKHEGDFITSKHTNRIFKTPIVVDKKYVHYIEDNETLHIFNDDFIIKTIYSPGHSIGSTVYEYENIYFTGDFIFSDAIGRVDLPTSNIDQMVSSIKRFMKLCNKNYLICPGHESFCYAKNLRENNMEIKQVFDVYGDKENE
ncbi:MBL fold metallo-hydrolase [Malacoplasma iowae]|uniref:MBL fold metallo-hydrolase n=1 Tax=Malacoplasma iowae 695 TaxID=1048830 RepID=A0A6P1LIL2_MALIO|nr:MBL fold metallo-hydrolase [Malacoplasma iowae]VEU62126.1 hydroxyacylglutathione hydrolase [Mycoplasmopsis fermentans]EGZ31637.1 metallo-beta-lactamase superfamily protein [Malacoplasma iowae 695]QHG89955.1 MBL fold metallo-hydrolase [Malacoplasma iowae 695]WPL36316.1 MBL fold metallo-hydrolase [Malacoplasma iowae]WPL39361.1 MBL fold metallo-hydrolase [Malacoplasma iowae]